MSTPSTDPTHLAPAPASAPPDRLGVLVLQGGGALGSYQAGACQALQEGGQEIGWVAGVSIGALNAALIAGNPPERRVERLRAFWETITEPTALWPDLPFEPWRAAGRTLGAAGALMLGQPGFFKPRWLGAWTPKGAISFYDTGELRATLERLVDFDRINHPAAMRLSVGAVEVETGNLVYFDNRRRTIGPEHIMASGALPPGLAVVAVEGRAYWDGGLVSNTPLDYVMKSRPREPMLVFQIDLFPARGKVPETLDEVAEREKDIRYSSRTRSNTSRAAERQALQGRIQAFLERLPDELAEDPIARHLRELGSPAAVDIVHLIYRPTVPQGSAKDYEFSRGTMRQRWQQGRADTGDTLEAAPWRNAPGPFETMRVFDELAPRGR
jgi:NTE family protein